MGMKSHIAPFVLLVGIVGVAVVFSSSASTGATPRRQKAATSGQKATTNNQKPTLKDCSCTGTGCSCSCSGSGCVCACDGGKCKCSNLTALTLSLDAGTTINGVVRMLSAVSGQDVLVLSGGEETIPFDLRNTTPWQALARLSALPGVKLGLAASGVEDALRSLQNADSAQAPRPEKVEDAFRSLQSAKPSQTPGAGKVMEIQRLPPTEVISLCVDEAELPMVLDTLSSISGTAFEVSGSPSGKFSLKAKGTVVEIVRAVAAQTGTTITLAQ